jgi:hypothetical protein
MFSARKKVIGSLTRSSDAARISPPLTRCWLSSRWQSTNSNCSRCEVRSAGVTTSGSVEVAGDQLRAMVERIEHPQGRLNQVDRNACGDNAGKRSGPGSGEAGADTRSSRSGANPGARAERSYRVTNSTSPVQSAAMAPANRSRSVFTPVSAPAAAASAARCERLPVGGCTGVTAIHLCARYWGRT